MSMFLPEGSQGAPQPGVASVTPANPQTTQEDIALMQRVFKAAAENPLAVPDGFWEYGLDYVQANNLIIPIGQVYGYQKIATQVITDFGEIPSPVDGQTVLLKVGSSSPFDYVLMTYDKGAGHWVSPEFACGGGSWSVNSSALTLVGGAAGISWAPVHVGGLSMQLKWSGFQEMENPTPYAGIALTFGNFTSGYTTSTMSQASVTGDGVNHPTGVDWATVTDPGSTYNMVAIGMYVIGLAGSTTNGTAAIVGRFIK